MCVPKNWRVAGLEYRMHGNKQKIKQWKKKKKDEHENRININSPVG